MLKVARCPRSSLPFNLPPRQLSRSELRSLRHEPGAVCSGGFLSLGGKGGPGGAGAFSSQARSSQ